MNGRVEWRKNGWEWDGVAKGKKGRERKKREGLKLREQPLLRTPLDMKSWKTLISSQLKCCPLDERGGLLLFQKDGYKSG